MADLPDDLAGRPVVLDMGDTEVMSVGFLDEIIVTLIDRGAEHVTIQGPTASIGVNIIGVLARRPDIADRVTLTPWTAPLVAVDGCDCSCHRPGGMMSSHIAACCGNSIHTDFAPTTGVDATPTH